MNVRLFGLAAVSLSVAFLAFLLISMAWKGLGGFTQTEAKLIIDFPRSNLFLEQAGKAEGKGRDQDALAYFREAIDYRNVLMAELPKGDFAFTIARQFFYSVFDYLQMEALAKSKNADIAGIAAKAVKEAA